ncbi:histidine kinase [Flexivirga endophytica]|uniref:histidine kinase n=1 Tax=Flexivirga endophytica TaxID=1849103 RepID=A0A916WYU7_9MICO|nr:sensor domain-containing protein [Flexivirga endophytica]GGB43032.1 histidine kinase [Flexivirga endophytica]GHB64518.1 histidine kinase [Flexivirga endophytica]
MAYSLLMSDEVATGTEPFEDVGRGRLPRLVRRTLTSTLYLLIAWPFQLAVFILNVTLVSTATSILLAPLSVPLAIAVASKSSAIERRMVSGWVGLEAPPVRRLARAQGERFTDYAVRVVSNPNVWLEVVWTLVAWVVSTITWVLTITWWSIAVAATTWPAYGWITHGHNGNQDPADLVGLHSFLPAAAAYVGIGLIFLITTPLVIIGLARAQGLVSTALLGRAQQEAKIAELTETRAAARVAESAQLSRLERDIHDGPQQRLVRLKMDLARMERQVGEDSHAILGLRAAIASTQETLDELRALSKGIAPPVLADRGLVAAVREAAGRATIPVTVEADLRQVVLPPHLEQSAYFVVSEALTNMAKHSEARCGLVSLQINGIDLVVSITDDGRGGAHLSKGSGLVGLQSRVRSVGGTLTIDSPVGGPTTVLAVFPLT